MVAYRIRLAEAGDAVDLPEIEQSAGEAFRAIAALAFVADGDNHPAERQRQLIAGGVCRVAADERGRLVGFLSAEIVAGDLHLWEVGVRLECQKAGIGRRLVEHAIADASARGLAAVTLTTFRDVPWNQPFYTRLGFATLNDDTIGPRLERILQDEAAKGLPRRTRCAMRLVVRR